MKKYSLDLGEPQDYLVWLRRATDDLREAQEEQKAIAVACRELGLSWQDIGRAMRVSKQAAQQRFGD